MAQELVTLKHDVICRVRNEQQSCGEGGQSVCSADQKCTGRRILRATTTSYVGAHMGTGLAAAVRRPAPHHNCLVFLLGCAPTLVRA